MCDFNDIFGNCTALSYFWRNPAKVRSIWADGTCLAITINSSRHRTIFAIRLGAFDYGLMAALSVRKAMEKGKQI